MNRKVFVIIIILMSIALIICTLWFYNSEYSPEPAVTFILALIGLITTIVKRKKPKTKLKLSNKKMGNELVSSPPKMEYKEELNTELEKSKTDSREDRIEMMKPKVHILFIDDDKKFNVVKILKDAGWKNTKSVIDIKGLDIPIVKDADIFFVDINGVGKKLKCENEGLDLALMLKDKYPKKKLVLYSAVKKNNTFHPIWDKCDYRLEKNALSYQFQKLVENYSLEIDK